MDENSSTMDSAIKTVTDKENEQTGIDENSMDSEISAEIDKNRRNNNNNRRILDDDDDDQQQSADNDDEEDSHRPKTSRRIIDDEDESSESMNNSKVVMKNLKSLCDDESSDEDDHEVANDEEGVGNGLDSSEDSSQSNEGPAETIERPKNPARASKTECENAISIIQKNAREDLIDVPYHCPEQKSLKEFLASLKCNKSKLITEEKVEKKTTKFKLLRDLPKMEILQKEVVNESNDPENQNSETTQTDTDNRTTSIDQRAFGSAKLTLKGEANSMIDLETGQTFQKRTIADTLILQLMKNGANRSQSNNPKFKAEPIPGAPLNALKRNLESQLDKKRKETILKILEVEKVAKEDEEEILDDEEFEVDYESDKKKRVIKQSAPENEEGPSELVNQSVFNEDEEEVAGDEMQDDEDEEDANDKDADEQENDDEEDDNSAEDEDESDADDEDDPLEDLPEGKRTLKRIVAMVDSDEEDLVSTQTQPGEGLNIDLVTEPAPLFEDIPTEGPKSYEFSATQNDNELFDLCSGKFTTQLPQTEPASQVEASQVRDFDLPSNVSIDMSNSPVIEDKIPVDDKFVAEDKLDDENVAGPQKYNLSSSEDENEGGQEQGTKKIKLKRKKKRIVIEDDDDDGDLPDENEDLGDEEEEEENDVDDQSVSDTDLPQEAMEELEEYEQFLTTQGNSDPKPPRMRVTDFIEKEAELSDSEWGSEDEDERGLDKIEDIGLVRDDEDFDGEQLRDEVGRIHMRQMVNEDNRELKYLKDMILNEEELDGQARQRTFRWLNVNNEDDFEKEKTEGNADDMIDMENHSSDEENEVKWRKIRYEREQAILENKEGITMESKLESVMRLTKDIKVIKSVNSGDVTPKEIVSPSFLMQDQSKKYMNLRQSFLLRDEETLSRLASISAKDCGSAVTDGKQNFVFRRIEEPNKNPSADAPEPKKRKSNGFPFGEKSNPVQKKRKV